MPVQNRGRVPIVGAASVLYKLVVLLFGGVLAGALAFGAVSLLHDCLADNDVFGGVLGLKTQAAGAGLDDGAHSRKNGIEHFLGLHVGACHHGAAHVVGEAEAVAAEGVTAYDGVAVRMDCKGAVVELDCLEVDGIKLGGSEGGRVVENDMLDVPCSEDVDFLSRGFLGLGFGFLGLAAAAGAEHKGCRSDKGEFQFHIDFC